MPKLSAKTMADRRRRIAAAAYRCFVRDGFGAASVDGICAEAGISKGAFYVHFKSKEELVHAVAEMRSEEIGPLAGDTIEALAGAVLDLVAPMTRPEAARFELEAMVAGIADPTLNARAAANLSAIRDRIAQAVTRITGRPGDAAAERAM